MSDRDVIAWHGQYRLEKVTLRDGQVAAAASYIVRQPGPPFVTSHPTLIEARAHYDSLTRK